MIYKDKYIFCKKEALSKKECKQVINDFELEEKHEGPPTEITIQDHDPYYESIISKLNSKNTLNR